MRNLILSDKRLHAVQTLQNKELFVKPNYKMPVLLWGRGSTKCTHNITLYCARPLGLHYNHYVSPSVRHQLENMLIIFKPQGIFISHFAYICMSKFPKHCMACAITFFDGRGLAGLLWPFNGITHDS